MGKPAAKRPAVQRGTYERVTLQPPRVENHIVPFSVMKNTRKTGTRTWMKFDASGNYEKFDCDRNGLLKRVTVPARDLRILGPIFSQSSHILARENAIVVNLEFVKAIITAEEVYFLDPDNRDVKPFVEQQLKMQLLPQNPLRIEHPTSPGGHACTTAEDGVLEPLPFEFRVLEIALDVVCNHLEEKVHDLDSTARPALDQLTKGISTRSLESVRMVKSQLTHLSARVQKVRDELMQLLDDDEDMADLYLTRKLYQAQHMDSPLHTIYSASGATVSSAASRKLARLSSVRSQGHASRRSSVTQSTITDYHVEELEMLLEAYFMQVDASLNKLSLVREYIDDTEDYVNVRLDHQRNQLFQFQITLGASALAIALGMGAVGAFSMNIPVLPYENPKWFAPTLILSLGGAALVFVAIVVYVRWKGLFEK